ATHVRFESGVDITRFRIPLYPKNGHRELASICPLSANSDLSAAAKIPSFNNIISARKQCRRKFETERLGGLEIDEVSAHMRQSVTNLCGQATDMLRIPSGVQEVLGTTSECR